MRLGLGVDTGGTYTDGVLYDYETNRVVDRAKRLTTPRDLREGIDATLRALDPKLLKETAMASLSTTLATNACVEGRGSRAALILLGYDPVLVERLRGEYGLDGATELHIVAGKHGQRGEPLEPPDFEAIDRIARGIEDRVEAVGVVEYWGIRDPSYERAVKARLRESARLPACAAHELTNEINSMRRAATTLLNARLISLIEELLASVRRSLDALGVRAPLMIVRGDGSLMTEAFARECPVETMLSGPAASVTGAMRLSGAEDLLVADVGGTTTDLSVVRGGRARLVSDGVNVGAWRTGTRAVDIRTVGLGGDSRVDWSAKEGLSLRHTRALPLCALAVESQDALPTLRELLAEERIATYSRGVFFTLRRRLPERMELAPVERDALDALSDGPLTIERLCERIGSKPYFLNLDRLESMGILLRSAFTPTDAMHITGDYNAFCKEASELGLSLLRVQSELDEREILDRVFDFAGERLHGLIARSLLDRAKPAPEREPDTLRLGYRPYGDEVDVRFRVGLPIVGIGAPAKVLLKRVADRLETRLVTPELFEVANAIGAACAGIHVEERVQIVPDHDALGIRGYSAHSSRDRCYAESLEDCVAWARREAEELARAKAIEMGALDVWVEVESGEQTGYAAGSARRSLLLEKWVIGRAGGAVPAMRSTNREDS